jgi:hypothetical protein
MRKKLILLSFFVFSGCMTRGADYMKAQITCDQNIYTENNAAITGDPVYLKAYEYEHVDGLNVHGGAWLLLHAGYKTIHKKDLVKRLK